MDYKITVAFKNKFQSDVSFNIVFALDFRANSRTLENFWKNRENISVIVKILLMINVFLNEFH